MHEVSGELMRLDFDVVGVRNGDRVVGFLRRENLRDDGVCGDIMETFQPGQIIAISTPLIDVFKYLADTEQVFVLSGSNVQGLVTRSDLQKPPVRVLLFGLISLLEMHMTHWISKTYVEEDWRQYLKDERIRDAEGLYKRRIDLSEEIALIDCLQFSDKKALILRDRRSLNVFGLSKSKGKSVLEKAQKLRDKLAHSQVDLETGSSWSDIVSTISEVERMLERSDARIEKGQSELK